MTETRPGSARGRPAAGRDPDAGLGGSLFWVAAAGAVLVLGLALRTDAPTERPPESTPPVPAAPAAESPAAKAPAVVPPPVSAAPAPLPPPAGPASRLVERALRDARRASPADGWTAQVAVLCDPAGAEAAVSRFADNPRLYVFPAEIGDRSCFRICWGSYPDADAARAAAVPPALLGEARAAPKRLSEVLP